MITQADSRKWMARLYNSFLFMEAKIMKMAKKLLALVLTGVMAVSMLTGCAVTDAAKANALEKALNSKAIQNPQTVEYVYENDLNSVAKKVLTKAYDGKEEEVTAEVNTLTVKAEVNTTSKTYAYLVVKAPKSADAKKATEWAVDSIYTATKNSIGKAATTKVDIDKVIVNANHSTTAGATPKAKFGVKFVEGKDGTAKQNYVIVVFETVKATDAQY